MLWGLCTYISPYNLRWVWQAIGRELDFGKKKEKERQELTNNSVAVISATRLVFVMHLDLTNIDIMWNFIDTEVWSTLEIFIAMICGTCPFTIHVLIPHILFIAHSWFLNQDPGFSSYMLIPLSMPPVPPPSPSSNLPQNNVIP